MILVGHRAKLHCYLCDFELHISRVQNKIKNLTGHHFCFIKICLSSFSNQLLKKITKDITLYLHFCFSS